MIRHQIVTLMVALLIDNFSAIKAKAVYNPFADIAPKCDTDVGMIQQCFMKANENTKNCIGTVVSSISDETHQILGKCAESLDVQNMANQFNELFEDFTSNVESCCGSDLGLRSRRKRNIDSLALDEYYECTAFSRSLKANCFSALIKTDGMLKCSAANNIKEKYGALHAAEKELVKRLKNCMDQ